jgi:hypothetical protein
VADGKGSHNRSVLDLIDASTELVSPSNAAQIAKFVHHQTDDKLVILRSDENEEGDTKSPLRKSTSPTRSSPGTTDWWSWTRATPPSPLTGGG